MELIDRLLQYYHIDEKELLERTREEKEISLPDPFLLMEGFSSSIDLIEKHIENKSKIVIFGDYDVDGITSTSILKLALNKRGVNCGFFIPSRYDSGYGITSEYVELFHQKGYQLIITVDNGICAFEAIKKTRELGMDVLIIDHHSVQDNLVPEANCIIHQTFCHYSSYNVSAAYLALLVYYGLNKVYDDYPTCLAGIAVISDMMEIKEANLSLVKKALNILNEGKYPQFNLMLENTLKKDSNIQVYSKDISYKIVAPLNSLGRLNTGLKINDAVRFLTSTNEDDILNYYKYIFSISNLKKQKLKDLKNSLVIPNQNSKINILILEDVEIGLLGGIVNSIIQETNKMTIVFSYKDQAKTILVGSGRSIEGYNLYQEVEKFKGDFLSFGGHPFAFGLSLEASKFETFKSNIFDAVNKLDFTPSLKTYVVIKPEDMKVESFQTILKFDPFGTGFPEAEFYCELDLSKFRLSKDGKHLLYFNGSISINYFFVPDEIKNNLQRKIKCVVNYSLGYFKGNVSYSFIVNRLLNENDEFNLIS